MAKTTKPQALAPLVVSEDEQITIQAGLAVREFLVGVSEFFRHAGQLEQNAKNVLATARVLPAPVTAAEDEEVQRFVKMTTAMRKETEAHWTITTVVHSFHRRLTSARERATAAIEEASNIGNRLHNGYVQAERRRAAEEQERLRVQAETQAREDRAKELLRMETAAIEADEAMPELSRKETDFVEALLGRCKNNPVAAARAAGYQNPIQVSGRLVNSPKIQAALESRRQAAAIREQAAARTVEPLEVEAPTIKPDISKAVGHDRTTWTAELLDEKAFIAAVLSGKYGIPSDVLTVRPAKLNEYARSLHERIDLWPGVRHQKKTQVV